MKTRCKKFGTFIFFCFAKHRLVGILFFLNEETTKKGKEKSFGQQPVDCFGTSKRPKQNRRQRLK